MSDVRLYTVRATPTGRGWELHIPGVTTLETDVLTDAHRVVRDYISEHLAGTYVGFDVMIIPAIGAVGEDFRMAKAALDDATRRYAGVVAELRRLGVTERDALTLTSWSSSRATERGDDQPVNAHEV